MTELYTDSEIIPDLTPATHPKTNPRTLSIPMTPASIVLLVRRNTLNYNVCEMNAG